MLNYFRRVIGLIGVYIFTSTSYKKDFNKGILLIVYIWSYIEERNGVKH